ncbi:MAG TPA: hypothetical protein VLJ59_00925 [Mycobacteriales bacterium]|nr:hypothetical protein [Mycobacteriales bacterium]
MPTSRGNSFSGNFNAPVVVGSQVDGDVSSSGDFVVQPAPPAGSSAELVALLAALRAEVAAAGPGIPKHEVILDNIDDLTADVEATEGTEATGDGATPEPEPAVARSRWAKIKSLLGATTQVTADLAKIGQSIGQLFGHG